MTQSINVVMVNPKVIRENTIRFLNAIYSDYKGKLFVPKRLGIVPCTDLSDKNFSKVKKVLEEKPVVFGVDLFEGRFDLDIEYETKPIRVAVSTELRSVFHYWFHENVNADKNFSEFIDFCKIVFKHSGASYFFAGIDAHDDYLEEVGNVAFLYCKEKNYSKLLQGFIEDTFKAKLSEEEVRIIVKEASIKMLKENDWIFINFMREIDGVFPSTTLGDVVDSHLKKLTSKK